MKRVSFSIIVLCLFSSFSTNASLIPISGYDIQNAVLSGEGNWGNSYTGTITPTGIGSIFQLGDYTGGGSGTLTDGIFSTDELSTHLLFLADNPVITIFLDGLYTIDSLAIFAGDFSNPVPGLIETVTATIGGSSALLNGSLFNTVDSNYDLTFTTLNGLATTSIVLSSFAEGGFSGAFSISEIRLEGALVSVPEPSMFAIIGICVGIVLFRKKKAASQI
jgi:hypothetical protein